MTRVAQAALGAAAASCIPSVAAAAAGGHPAYLVAGAFCGCLPDLADGVLAGLGWQSDMRIVPDPSAPAACDVAAALALAAGRAVGGRRAVRLSIEAPPVRDGVYLCCRVLLRPASCAFEVSFHHATEDVTPDGEGAGLPVSPTQWAVCPCSLLMEDMAGWTVSPRQGLSLELRPAGFNAVQVVFEPRRRQATHSLVAAAAVAAWGWAFADAPAAGAAAVAVLSHLVADNGCCLGVAWFFPFVRRRLRLVRSRVVRVVTGPLPAVVGALAVIGWNLHRAAAGPLPPQAVAGVRGALLAAVAVALAARGMRRGSGSKPVRRVAPVRR